METKQSKETVIEIFRRLELFTDLDTRALEELSNLFFERRFKKNEVIFQEETPGDSMMVITSGEVRVSQTPHPDMEEALVVLKKGDFFGEMAVLEALPRSATAIAHTDVIIVEINRNYFLKFVELDTASGVKILLKLARIMSARLREADKKLKHFTSLAKWI